MPVPAVIADLSPVINSNSPLGTDSAKGTIDDYFRAHAGFIRQLSDGAQASTSIVTDAAGTADALTGAFTPAIAALSNGLTVIVRAASANATATPTFKADGTALKTIVKGNCLPLVAGDIAGAGHWLTLTYDLALDKWVLENPSTPAALAASSGASLMGFIAAGAGAVARTMQAKAREFVSVADYYAGGGDHTTAVQAAATAGSFSFKSGVTYNLTADITIPSNTKIIVEKGAIVNTIGRFTSYNVNDVEWHIDGIINVTAMSTAVAKTGWPNTAAGTQNGDERGFIEFGGSDLTTASVSGFTVHGYGKIIGPFVGTPNFSNSVYQVNRKGIAGWNLKNMLVEGVEISGFDGEQVYAFVNTVDCTNIVFNKVNSHHCRFNALNFNVSNATQAGSYRDLKIVDCVTDTSFTGIEASAGVIEGNFCRAATNYGIWFGAGAGAGPITIRDNTVQDCALQSYVLSFSSSLATPIYDTTISDNKAINSGTDAFAFNKLVGFSVKNNQSRGHASASAGKAFSFTNCTQGWVDGNITFDPGAFSNGNLVSATSILNFGSNPVILAGGTTAAANGNHFGFGGKYAAVATYGNRENQWAAWSTDFGAAGTGAEYVFKNGSVGNVIYGAISGKGNNYDVNGSTGGIVIATKKASTSVAVPTATAEFNDAGNTILSGNLTVATGFGCNSKAPQTAAVSGGTVGGVIAALVANGILSS